MADVEDVENKIMSLYKEMNLGANEFIMMPRFISERSKWTPPERRLVDEALKNLVGKGYVVTGRLGLTLTEAGETFIYE